MLFILICSAVKSLPFIYIAIVEWLDGSLYNYIIVDVS